MAPSISQKDSAAQTMSNGPFKITLLTLVAYAFGLLFIDFTIISCLLMVIFCLLITKSGDSKLFYQSPYQILSFALTTYVFGLIHVHTFHQVINFFKRTSSQKQIWPLLEIYLSFISFYYYFEFQLNNCFHHRELKWKCIFNFKKLSQFIIQNSTQSLIYFVLFNTLSLNTGLGLNINHILIYPALVIMVLGECLRISAFFTAKSNFTHLVRQQKDPNHKLITYGVYSFFRHPSYTGYFYFSVGSQLFLGNWVCSVLYFIVLVKFFTDRIADQQFFLSKFFTNYLFYKKNTYILIPFVKDPDPQEIMKLLIKTAQLKDDHDQ